MYKLTERFYNQARATSTFATLEGAQAEMFLRVASLLKQYQATIKTQSRTKVLVVLPAKYANERYTFAITEE
jgi:hypothetical protein